MDVYAHLVHLANRNGLKVVHDPGSPLFHMVPMDKAIDLGVTSIEHGKANQAIAILKTGKEHYNPEAGDYLGPDYEQQAAIRIEALSKVDIPTLIIQGRQDPMPESVALENQKLLKAKLVWLDRCGHWPWIEQPAAMEKALFEFLFH